MAEEQHESGVQLDHSQFRCAVCLNLLKDPVTIHCGHNYCKSCIDAYWDHVETTETDYCCPLCRETFFSRPVLRRNNMLAEVVETLMVTSTHQAAPYAAGPSDVACDFCCATKPKKATMSCLTCLASYCPFHLESHSTPVLKTHQLVPATVPLQARICTKHNKPMELYCQTDMKLICSLCSFHDHKHHNMTTAKAVRAIEQKRLTVRQKMVQKNFQEREDELKELGEGLKDFKLCTQTTVKSCDKLFEELLSSVSKRHAEMKALIEAQHDNAVARAEDLQLHLEEEIARLKKRHTDLEELCLTEDHIGFLQAVQTLSPSGDSSHLPSEAVADPQQRSIRSVTYSVLRLKNGMDKLFEDTWPQISATVTDAKVLPAVPKKRDVLLRYCCPLSLDKNSISDYFGHSQDKRRVTREKAKFYPVHSDRFVDVMQVLCREGQTGRCYWEVSLSGGTWSVAMSYKDIVRKSMLVSEFGKNDKSWSLKCSPDGYAFQHNSTTTAVSGPKSSRIGVYLDSKAGTLSFYSVSDTMTLLHTVHKKFTRPLYPGLGLSLCGSRHGQSAELIKLW